MLGDVDFIMLGGRQTVGEYAKEKGGDQHSSDKCEHTNRSHEHLLENGIDLYVACNVVRDQGGSVSLPQTGYFTWNPFVNADMRAGERIIAPSVAWPALLNHGLRKRVAIRRGIINTGFTWLEFLMSKVSAHCNI